jgi:sugar porter (SP) family MFS transporter
MRKTLFVAMVVSLGGFLFGFDAGIISGVMSYAGPEFDLNDFQNGWAVSAPSFAAILAMLVSGRLSDVLGRKRLLLYVAFTYALSAVLSAYAVGYHMLWIARFIGGLAFGAALVIAPAYIAEISTAENRGRLVSVQQLNIVLGFFAAFISNYFFNKAYTSGTSSFLTEANVWRWMLGVELLPAVLYFFLLFFIPRSPRWLATKGNFEEAEDILSGMHGKQHAAIEIQTIANSLSSGPHTKATKIRIKDLFSPALKYVMTIGLIIGLLQQVTGINAIYFYATSIFKQTGIGTDAAFASGILLSLTTVVFTVIAMLTIDKFGRRPLMLYGIAGITISLLLCAYGFSQASYQLSTSDIETFSFKGKEGLRDMADQVFISDVDFKNALKDQLGTKVYSANDGLIMEAAITVNANLVLIGILGFVACFAFSLGPVMWVMLSELFPNRYRGAAIGFIASVNGFASWLVQFIFPWELSHLGNAMTFFIFGAIALLGCFIMLKTLPETKGKSLEALEKELLR